MGARSEFPVVDGLPASLRRQQTRRLLDQQGFVRVHELSERFGISTVTVRSDLQTLEELGLAQRVHGGAVPHQLARGERTFEEVASEYAEVKAAIGQTAAAMVTSGESILIDVGTTTAAFADALVARADLEDLTVFTNGIRIAMLLEEAHPRFSIVVTGGTLRPKQHSLVDPLAGTFLSSLSVDTVFIGCNGVDAERGATNINLPEADIKRAMIAAAKRCVVLANGTKLGVRALAPICPVSDIDVLVTDTDADSTVLEALRERGVDVYLC